MKLDSFRELLLKKVTDPSLHALIKYADENVLAQHAIESLEKMARSKHKGDAANFAVRNFGTEMDPETEPHMIRDAIGHHVSNYKAALNNNNAQAANHHAKQAFKLMNMADVAQKHSNGKLSIEYVPTQPWERNKFTKQYDSNHDLVRAGKYKPGDFVTKTKGLNYRGSDFGFLQQPPHEAYAKEVSKHGHNKAYPFEQIKVNGKHIHVDDNAKGDMSAHEFDAHPIMRHFEDSVKDRSAESDKKYLDEAGKYYNDEPHIGKYFERHQNLEQQDPKAYAERGSKASTPVHKDIEGLKLDNLDTPEPSVVPIKDAPAAKPEVKVKPAAKKEDKKYDFSWMTKEQLDKMPPEIQQAIQAHLNKEKK